MSFWTGKSSASIKSLEKRARKIPSSKPRLKSWKRRREMLRERFEGLGQHIDTREMDRRKRALIKQRSRTSNLSERKALKEDLDYIERLGLEEKVDKEED